MNIISVMCNGYFWIAIIICFLFSFIIAVIVQDVYDTLVELKYPEYEEVDIEPTVGCHVYDILNEDIGIYCGTCESDGDTYAVIVSALNENTVCITHSVFENIIVVQEQE